MGSRRGDWPATYDHYFKERSPRPEKSKQVHAKARKATGTASLTPQEGVFDTQLSKHLMRRAGFGASCSDLETLNGAPVGEAVSEVVQAAIDQPLPEPPHWVNEFLPSPGSSQAIFDAYFNNNGTWGYEYSRDWVSELFAGGLQERMAMFWHNHFVTEIDVYFFAPMAYRYLTLLRTHALGNFKQMVYDVGIDPAMLVYLDGHENPWWEPNENYARELLELFTMGQFDKDGDPNYTQGDISEMARSLTGWSVDYYSYTSSFSNALFDPLKKTIFGVEDKFDYDKVIDLLFEHRSPQIAYFICAKLYAAFVHEVIDEDVVDEMTTIFLDNDFEIAPVVEALLKSAHFFAQDFRGARFKSPTELLVGMMSEADIESFRDGLNDSVYWKMRELGQQLLQPPNVGGWTEYRDWITTSTLPNRWQFAGDMLLYDLTGHIISFVPLSYKLHDPGDPLLVFKLPVLLVEYFIAVPPDQLSVESSAADFGGDLDTYPIPAEIMEGPQHVLDLTKVFLQGKPWYEWHLGQAGIVFFMLDYVQFLIELPEYQLT